MYTVCDQVEPEKLCRIKRERPPKEESHGQKERGRRASGEQEEGRFAQVVRRSTTFLDRRYDRDEVVVGEHHVGGFTRNIGSTFAHRDADISCS